MFTDGKITQEEYINALNFTPEIITSNKNFNQYINACIEEACTVLHMQNNQIFNKSYTIFTYFDQNLQKITEEILHNNTSNLENISTASLVTDNNGKVLTFAGNTPLNLYNTKRQPGSIIKPVLVYAPAIEYDIITPETIITDEPINIDGYSPENANKKYHGNVSVKESLSKSLNIPTVKILNTTGIKRSKNIANKMGINFHEKDQNLSLALGGFTTGCSMLELTESYLTLQNRGINIKPKFIKKIVDSNNTILYEDNSIGFRVIKETTADSITEMLLNVAKNGTASRLSSLNIPIASKTGTVGLAGSNKNIDAWNASYTTKHVILTWLGTTDHSTSMDPNVNGSSYPTNITKNICTYLYKSQKPNDFILLTTTNLKSNSLAESATTTSKINTQENTSILHKPLLFINNFSNKKPELRFFTQFGLDYHILKNNEIIQTVSGTNNYYSYTDTSANKNEINTYSIIIKNENQTLESNKIKVLCLK